MRLPSIPTDRAVIVDALRRLAGEVGGRYLLSAAGGAALALVLSGALAWAGIKPDDTWASARDQCLVAAGLLLVPASIFPAVVGAMFPAYWRATPTTIIRDHPIKRLLYLLAWLLGYSLACLAMPVGPVLVVILLFVVGLAAAMAVNAVRFSLQLLDPGFVVQTLRDKCRDKCSGKRQKDALEAHSDLCRFIEGLVKQDRRAVVTSGVRCLEELWTGYAAILDAEYERSRVNSVLKKCEKRWPKGPAADAVAACRATLQRPSSSPVP